MSMYSALLRDALTDLAVAAGDVIENSDAAGRTDDLIVTSAPVLEQLTLKLKAALAVLRK